MRRRVTSHALTKCFQAVCARSYSSAFLCMFLWFSVCAFLHAQSSAGCNIPPAAQSMFRNPPQPGAGFADFRMLGNSYQNYGCLDEADTAYRQMASEAQILPENRRKLIQNLAALHLEFTAGLRSWQKGDFPAAFAAFSDVTGAGLPNDLTVPGLHAYAQLMTIRFDPSRWDELKVRLSSWDNQGYWNARAYLTFCDLTPVTADSKITQLRDLLLTDLPTETRLADQVILIDLFVRTRHLLEADLMVRSIEPDIGGLAWSRDLRIYFLQISSTLYSGLAQQGNADAADRLSYYQKAIGELNVGQ